MAAGSADVDSMSDTNLVTGRIINILETISGESSNGTWKKGGFVVEVEGKYPKAVKFDVWGEAIDNPVIQPGAIVTVAFDLQSREYNGKWYTDAKAWKIEAEQMPTETPGEPQAWESALAGDDGLLPF